MPAIKCMSCKQYSPKEGCELERHNQYFDFRACMLDERSYFIPKDETEVKKDDLRESAESKCGEDLRQGLSQLGADLEYPF